jgi:putative heme-binding domain-containing protein
MSKLGYARMPYIGSRVVDSAGVALIEAWIRSLSDDPATKLTGPAKTDSDGARALGVLANSGAAMAEREAAIRQLVGSTEGSLALVARLHAGKLTAADARFAVSLGGAASSDVRGLYETFVPESQRRPTLGPKFDPQVVLGKTGDVARGKLIFHSDGARCRACHDADDRKLSLGPTLKEINKKYAKLAELLQHVAQPSLKIDEPFAAYIVVTTDGRTLTGLIDRQSDQEVVLRTAEKRTITLARGAIEELRKSDKSLMPDLVLSDLTAQEAADLFEYIRSLGAAP